MKKQYLELAQQACESERLGHWEQASHLWMQAIELAYGVNIPWANARLALCCHRIGVRLASFKTKGV
ncbi:ANR family transcriptional regulator [Vibrio sp. V43_P6S15P86]|uniref:ANR family transcriptional regulator n=1 Tax=Vibrio sp. V43_P6S15P86 TaxID=1938694 RepID=UPI001372738D|nr:ANR family transcriptional regulator [Vibrio sp. V43_P6S15P86]NAW84333.1 ANR family transcriptional regulator [Vibrio sp. V43_P6S15P86]